MATTLVRIQLLSKTSTDFATANPVLLDGEIGVANAGASVPVMKVGDGVRPWSALPDIVAAGAGADYVAGPVNTLPPGSPATVVIDNSVSPPTISFGIPSGAQGPIGASGPVGPVGPLGPAGPPNSLTIGIVTTGAAGSAAAATITGAAPNQTLNLTIPTGAQGPVGAIGPAGPANTLAIGVVTTGAPGSAAAATITGAAPNQTLNLAIPAGIQGPQGIQGIQGPPGSAGTILADDSLVTGDWVFDATQWFGFTTAEVAQIKTAALIWTNDGKDSLHAHNRLYLDRLNSTPNLGLTRVNGAYNAMTPMQNGQFIGAIGFYGSNGAGLPIAGGASIFATARENWTATSAATSLDIYATPTGSITPNRVVQIIPGDNVLNLFSAAPYISYYNAAGSTRLAYMQASSAGMSLVHEMGGVHIYAAGIVRVNVNATAAPFIKMTGTSGACYFFNGALEDTHIRPGKTTGGVYIGDASTAALVEIGAPTDFTSGTIKLRGKIALQDFADGYLRLNASSEYSLGVYTPGRFRSATYVQADTGFANDGLTSTLKWGPGGGTYGTMAVQGAASGFHGLAIDDGGLRPTFISNNSSAGIFVQSDGKWLFYRTSTTTADSHYTVQAPAFNATSSRKIKRETGEPTRAADILSRLRPIMYRLLRGDKREQLGLIAEEVADICPQLSDGKTISYDRLAILLLAEWQASHGVAIH
jgi:hypothetical protein